MTFVKTSTRLLCHSEIGLCHSEQSAREKSQLLANKVMLRTYTRQDLWQHSGEHPPSPHHTLLEPDKRKLELATSIDPPE